jgi:hypothetical protein
VAYTLLVKAVTYLGNPHPIHKKRIQISGSWKANLSESNSLLIGVYSYKKTILFILFDSTKYKNNSLNNSSAHVHTIDLQKGLEYGVFRKTDSRGNEITVFRPEKFAEVCGVAVQSPPAYPKEIALFDAFFSTVPRDWYGKECYQEMYGAEYRNRRQPEWAGFYFEYLFEKFLDTNPEWKKVCAKVSNKKKEGLDFDISFTNGYLGDLKTHSEKSGAILGNDKASILEVLARDGKFWYVVATHTTVKDKDMGHEVTRFWNQLLIADGLAKNELSYATRMKHSISLSNFKILEIHKGNIGYLQEFNQGVNPGGNSRAVKIQILNKDIDNFLVYSKEI